MLVAVAAQLILVLAVQEGLVVAEPHQILVLVRLRQELQTQVVGVVVLTLGQQVLAVQALFLFATPAQFNISLVAQYY
jgi:hypothetical protein